MPRGTAYPIFTGYAVAAEWIHLQPTRTGFQRRIALLLRPIDDRVPGRSPRCVLSPGDELRPSFKEKDFEEAPADHPALRGLARAIDKLRLSGQVLDAAAEERRCLQTSIARSGIELEGFSDQSHTYALRLAQYRQRYGEHRGAVERL